MLFKINLQRIETLTQWIEANDLEEAEDLALEQADECDLDIDKGEWYINEKL